MTISTSNLYLLIQFQFAPLQYKINISTLYSLQEGKVPLQVFREWSSDVTTVSCVTHPLLLIYGSN